MRKKCVRRLMYGILAGALALPGVVQAFSVSDFVLTDDAGLSPVAYFAFTPVTNNGNLANIDLGLAVSYGNIDGIDRMFFEFVNESTDPQQNSSIKGIFFETTLLSGANAYNEGTDPGVDFTVGPSGMGDFGFPINHALDATADPPPAQTGVNPGESLLLGYALLGADPAATAISVLNGLTSGAWDIGIHLIATDGGAESEKLISTYLQDGPQDPGPQDPVPEPATVVLLGMGATFLIARMRLAT